jgi:Spy/CpxP family protein refolding chaperone
MNQNRHFTTTIILMAAVALLLVSWAAAQGPDSPRGHAGKRGAEPAFAGRWERLCERLELSADQKQAMEKIREEARGERLELRKDLLRLQNELHGLMLADEPSEKEVADLIERIGDIKTKRQQSRMSQRLAIRRLLTDEQRDQLMLGRDEGRRGGRQFDRGERRHGGEGWGRSHPCPRRDGGARPDGRGRMW